MLKLRLQRVGRLHEPSFRLVLTESKNSSKSGRFKEILGSYDPRKSVDSIDSERVKHWMSQGVSTTATVHNLLVKHKIINAKKINVSAKSKKPARTTEDVQSGGAPVINESVAEAPKETETPKEEVIEESKVEEAPQAEAPAESAIIEESVEEEKAA